jgi:3-phosphoshikimate 1-carboxyvinyltransferase
VSDTQIRRARKLQGLVRLPGDKSISHRAALLSLLCTETIEAHNFAPGDDCGSSLKAVAALGCGLEQDSTTVRISPPSEGMITPEGPIDCGNSGTTMRLLAGILAGSGMTAQLIGDESLSQRPMNRIVEPLRLMNADIAAAEGGTSPIDIKPAGLIPIDYIMPVSSAQVKSSLLLAGLASGTNVIVREKAFTRDHTERMVRHLGGKVSVDDVTPEFIDDPHDPRKRKKVMPTDEYRRTISVDAGKRLSGGTVEIPGDVSTAAYFIAAALLIPGSHLILKNVGLNPTRTAFINITRQMGADIKLKNRREISGEPVGDLEVRYARLKPRKISGDAIPNLIDEVPVLGVLAAAVEGTTIIRDAEELRHKESDRIRATVANLETMGVKVGEFPDGFAVEGTGELNGGEFESFGDHRIAMAFSVAGLAAHGKSVMKDSGVVAISCPNFYSMLEGLRVQ